MPIPKPGKKEKEKEFIDRCMSNAMMKKEYPDDDQRLAVCYGAWKKEKKSMQIDKESPEYKSKELEFGSNIELRTYPAEFRLENRKDDTPLIRGYAAVFDKLSEDLGSFREVVKKGAFTKTIREADVRGLFNHDPNYVLGRTRSGTLKLKEDDYGLAIEIDPPDTQWARDLMISVRRGDINQMSFQFRTIKDAWFDKDDDKKRRRELLEVKLIDTSIVTFPAYPQTSVAVRNYIQELMEEAYAKPDLAIHLAEEGIEEEVHELSFVERRRKRLDWLE